MSLREATINVAMAVYEGILDRGLMGYFQMELMKYMSVSLHSSLSRIKGLEKKVLRYQDRTSICKAVVEEEGHTLLPFSFPFFPCLLLQHRTLAR